MNRSLIEYRINSFCTTNVLDRNYLHYKYFHKDLKNILSTYVQKDDIVLDIGCGNKPYERYIRSLTKRADGKGYVGCDVAQSSDFRVDFLCDATKIPLESESFNIVICTQVLEHVYDFENVILEAYRLLKPEGVLIVSAPLVWPHHEIPYDFFRFTYFGLKKLLLNSEFKIEYQCANGGKWAELGLIFAHVLSPSKSKYFFIRKLLSLFNRVIITILNIVFCFLDEIFKDTAYITINHVFVGKK